jgi:hypothetical protein
MQKYSFIRNSFDNYAANLKLHFMAVKLKFSLIVWLYNVLISACHILPGRGHQ